METGALVEHEDRAHESSQYCTGPETELTWKLVEAACLLIRRGMKPARAMHTLRIVERTWYRWKAKARQGIEPYAERVAEIEQAEAIYLGEVEMALGDASKDNWKAALEILRRRVPAEYGNHAAMTPPQSEAVARPIEKTEPAAALTAEERRARLKVELEKRGLPSTIFAE